MGEGEGEGALAVNFSRIAGDYAELEYREDFKMTVITLRFAMLAGTSKYVQRGRSQHD